MVASSKGMISAARKYDRARARWAPPLPRETKRLGVVVHLLAGASHVGRSHSLAVGARKLTSSLLREPDFERFVEDDAEADQPLAFV